MSVCADATVLLELFPNVFEVHYKLLQRILQNFDAGGLLSGWSFVRGWHFQWSFVRWSFVRTPSGSVGRCPRQGPQGRWWSRKKRRRREGYGIGIRGKENRKGERKETYARRMFIYIYNNLLLSCSALLLSVCNCVSYVHCKYRLPAIHHAWSITEWRWSYSILYCLLFLHVRYAIKMMMMMMMMMITNMINE